MAVYGEQMRGNSAVGYGGRVVVGQGVQGTVADRINAGVIAAAHIRDFF